MSKRACVLLVAAALLASPRAAVAEPVDAARVLYDAGVTAYAAGRFGAAVQAFSEAYALAPKPSVLFSLAQAERRFYTAERDKKALKDAITHFRKYLDEVPQGGRRADAVEALGELEAAAARADVADLAAERRRAPTRIMVSSPTKDATITVNGKPYRESPVVIEVAPGKYKVRISAPGYEDESREIVAVEGTLVPFEAELRDKPSFLAVSAPNGALVSIDGRVVGESPLTAPLSLPPGKHLVVITRTGYNPSVQQVEIKRGETLKLRVALKITALRAVTFNLMNVDITGALVAGGLGVGAFLAERKAKGILEETKSGPISSARLDAYNDALASRDRLKTASLATLGVTATLSGVTVFLYAFDNPAPKVDKEPGAPAVSLAIVPGAGALSVAGRF